MFSAHMDAAHGKRRADHSAKRVLLFASCLGVVLAVVYVSRWVTMAVRHEFAPAHVHHGARRQR